MRRPSVFNDMSKWRLSRRRLIAGTGAAGLGLAGLSLIGCGSKESSVGGGTPTAASLTPKAGGHLKAGSPGMPPGFDPHTNDAPYVFGRLYECLYNVDFTTQKSMLKIAESIENPDPQTFIFKLRKGVKFAATAPMNGREITSEDVMYSWNRRKDMAGKANKALQKDYTDAVSAPDKYTFKVVLKKPFGPAFNEMGDVSYAIVAKEGVEKFTDLSRNAAGSGPFLLGAVKEGDTWSYARNPDYREAGLPYIDGTTIKVIADESAAMAAFTSKQVDVCSAQLDLKTWGELGKTKGVVAEKTYTLWTAPLWLNCSVAPFKDGRVRRALQIGWDRAEMVQKVVLGDGDWDTPISFGMPYWISLEDKAKYVDKVNAYLKFDLTKAKQLMDAAGLKDGVDVEYPVMNISAMPSKLEPYIPAWQKIGFRFKMKPQDAGGFVILTLGGKKFAAASFWDNPSDNPDYNMARLTTKGTAGTNQGNYSNAELDAMLDDARSKLKIEERRDAYQKMALRALALEGDESIPIVYCVTGYGYGARWHWVNSTLPKGYQVAMIPDPYGTYVWMSDRD